MFAQDQIMGKIIDNNGMPLLGATVVEKGTSNGTQSDMMEISPFRLLIHKMLF